MKKLIISTIIILAPIAVLAAPNFFLQANSTISEPKTSSALTQKLSGRILLDVEKNGEAWFVFPSDQKRYFLKRPSDAFALMRKLGKGITNNDLSKIPVGLLPNNNQDTDQDGLDDKLETALGTDPKKSDSDGDGDDDKQEIQNEYNSLGKTALNLDKNLADNNSGKIFLQVESAGQAWYLNPLDKKRYFLGSPSDAFNLMKKLGWGVKNADLNKITIGEIQPSFTIVNPTIGTSSNSALNQNPGDALTGAASAIRQGDTNKAQTFFIPEMRKSIEYGVKALSPDSRLLLANILSGSSLDKKSDTEATYKNTVYFSLRGEDIPIVFTVKKQSDGGWLMASL